MILETVSHARAGLIGNPSDGYFGKTLSFTMTNFSAKVTMWESPDIQFMTNPVDEAVFKDLKQLMDEIYLYGYYGGIRLLKATTKVFVQYCTEHGIDLPQRNFSVRYESNIPRLVGMAGSSAICTAMFRALTQFFDVDIPREIMATLCLNAEVNELSLQAGLQDRVAQVYGGVMFMDFNESLVTRRGYGEYRRVDKSLLPNLYVAYDPTRAEVSGRYHRNLRVLFEQHDSKVVDAMAQFAEYAQRFYDCLLDGNLDELPGLINANFDLRDRIFNVSEENKRMVMTARDAGASAKFAGSGGTIVGTYEDEAMYRRLEKKLGEIGCRAIKPQIPDTLD
ncbi:MAG: GHMP kinase [Deltaproteobacteria bacterium]|nr:GHMP kinase [Deltaproteobacteria bacterium]MBW1960332.1 GHMP kinase [Deltaproteobacteria bacterium]MBW1994531.1 GHMP kinase [Deltaproteobacteria bacterium]MBW2152568.1 GHMP kinase [Deltaproteobacteria bacterium]